MTDHSTSPRQPAVATLKKGISAQLLQMITEIKGRMSANSTSRQSCPLQWEELGKLLEALPLSTAEFGTAINRLRNAQCYVDEKHLGAAHYELLSLMRKLERLL